MFSFQTTAPQYPALSGDTRYHQLLFVVDIKVNNGNLVFKSNNRYYSLHESWFGCMASAQFIGGGVFEAKFGKHRNLRKSLVISELLIVEDILSLAARCLPWFA